MTSHTNSRPIERILVIRLGSMGDIIHALPAVAALHRLFPAAQIGWAIEERWSELLCAVPRTLPPSDGAALRRPRSPAKPLVDHIHITNTRAWRTEPFSDGTWKAAVGAARQLRRTRYQAAFDFQGAWKSAVVAMVSGAPARIGFSNPREHAASLFYTRQVPGEGTHVIEQNLSLLRALIHVEGDEATEARQAALREPPPAAELPLDDTHELWASEELVRHGLFRRDFAIINPGAGWGAKCWPAESYAEVARGLAELGVPSLINFGPGEEELARAVESASGGTALASRYTISELIALLRRARLFLGGDTGPMHLAAALRVPVVAIFGPTSPLRNGPYGTPSIVLRSPESVTNHSRRAGPDAAMLSISAQAVLAAAQTLLERTTSSPGLATPAGLAPGGAEEVRRG